MDSLLAKITGDNMPFGVWYESLTEAERRLVTKARRQGLLVINLNADGTNTVSKVVA